MKWFEPDTRWELFRMKSREDFIDNYVVTGKFHDQVPEDIVTAFETVSHLMVYSYYHWPMMDEAMTKALLVMEMALKLKAKQGNIDLETVPNKKGKTFQKKLAILIDEVCKVNHLDFLKPDFDRFRTIRNSRMHPERHNYMGALGKPKGNVMLFINIINVLFMEKKVIEELIKRREELKIELEPFKNGSFVLEYNNTLIDMVHYHKYVKYDNKELLLLSANSLATNVYEMLTNHRFYDSKIIALKDFKITGSTIEGTDLNDEVVKISVMNDGENLLKFIGHTDELDRVSENDKHLYLVWTSQKAIWKIEEIIHENCWE
jgi:hypothetical protein